MTAKIFNFAVAPAKLVEYIYEGLPHLSNSRYVGWFFSKLVKVDCLLRRQKMHFSNELKKRKHRWVKCIELKGIMLRNMSRCYQNFGFSFVGYVFIASSS